MRFTILLCVGYWILLTVLLLVPSPSALVGLHTEPNFPWGKFGVHLGFFTVLSILANFSRWPNRLSWLLIASMAAYGLATEWLQFFVPHRSSRIMDSVENLLGIALGVAMYWVAWRLIAKEQEIELSEEDAMQLERLSRIGKKGR